MVASRLGAWFSGLSLRYQVGIGVAAGVALVTLAFGLIATYVVQRNIRVAKEERLSQAVILAAGLDALAQRQGDGEAGLSEPLSLAGLTGLHSTVIEGKGNVLAASSEQDLARAEGHLALMQDLVSRQRPGVVVHGVPGNIHIVAFAPMESVPGGGVIVEAEEDRTLLVQLQLLRILPFFGLGVLMVASVSAWAHARYVVRPLAQLQKAAATIAQGRLDEPITTTRQDEIGQLARSFDAMRFQVKAASEARTQWETELERRVGERTTEVQRLVGRVIDAQERERRRLAQELHDDTAQALAAILMGVETLRDSLPPGQDRVKQHVERTLAEGQRALQDLRRVILGLRPAGVDEMGVVAAMRSYAGVRLGPAGVALEFSVQGQERRPAPAVEAALFRILQEAVNNIARHARAQNATVRFDFQAARLVAVVEDDGQGFDQSDIKMPRRGLGLQGMQERADIINARLEVTSAPGKGTRVRVLVPWEEAPHG